MNERAMMESFGYTFGIIGIVGLLILFGILESDMRDDMFALTLTIFMGFTNCLIYYILKWRYKMKKEVVK